MRFTFFPKVLLGKQKQDIKNISKCYSVKNMAKQLFSLPPTVYPFLRNTSSNDKTGHWTGNALPPEGTVRVMT